MIFFRANTFDLEAYLVILRQIHRQRARPIAPLCSLAVAIRHGPRTSGDWPLAPDEAARIIEVLDREERLYPGRLDRGRRAELARLVGREIGAIDELVGHFEAVREEAVGFIGLGMRGRFKILMDADPVLGWIRGRVAMASGRRIG